MHKFCLALLLGFLLLVPLAGCQHKPAPSADSPQALHSEKTTVLYFHGKKRCITCRAIERHAQELVSALPPEQVGMRIIDITDPANQPLVQRFKVSWSALFLVKGEQSVDLTKMAFRYAKSDPNKFKELLTSEIHKLEAAPADRAYSVQK